MAGLARMAGLAGADAEIYLDYAATAPLRDEVREAMEPWLRENFGNPSSIYRSGRRARHALDAAREVVAAAIGAHPSEIIFTSGGTEADNLALKGIAWAVEEGGPPAGRRARKRIVASAIEHHAVLRSADFLQRRGWPVSWVRPDANGVVQVDSVASTLDEADDVLLVSLMHANNEVGTVQPVSEVGRLCRERGVWFHVDAVQSFGKLPVNVQEIGCHLLALSAHKIGGPKGVGCLYVRQGTPLAALLHGGGQERELRAGTENVAGIVGFARAVELAMAEREAESRRLAQLADQLREAIVSRVPGVRCSGEGAKERLPGLVHLVFEGIDAETLLLNLDLKGVAASSGSACTSGSLEPSHVLLAMGMSEEEARGSLRLSLGRGNTEEQVRAAAAIVVETVEKLRERRRSRLYGGSADGKPSAR